MNHFHRLNECYDVKLYKSTYDIENGNYDLPYLNDSAIIRIFPTEKRKDNMKEIGMAMLYTKKSPNDIKVENDLDLFKYIPDDVMERN